MRYLASDVETVGLYDKVHNKSDVHCLCSIDCDTDEVYLFHDHPEFDEAKVWDEYDEQEFTIPKRTGTLEDGIKFWEEASASGDKLVIHNTHTFDRLIVDKLWPSNSIDFEAYHDTYIQSKVQWYERPTPKGSKGAHGLKAYGIRCGVNKPEITDWVQLDAYKMHRVVQDCRIQAETFKLLEKERKGLLDKYGIDFTIALKIESHYAADVAQQELDGAKVDIPYINTLIVDLDNKLEKLTEEIEPELPPTVKGKGVKLSRKEVAEALGRNPEKTKDKYIQKKVNGEVTTVVEKPYFKPCTSYTKVIKSNLYSGFHITVGESPSFNKKKDLTDWIKATTNTKTNEWDIEKSEVEREVLNKNTCDYFGIEEDSDLIVGPFTKVDINPSKMTQNDVVKKFLIRLGWKHAEEWNLKKNPYGAYVKAEENTTIVWPLNAAPENQMKRFVKKGDYILTTPKLSEDEYSQLPEGVGKKIAEYNTYQHRRRFLSNPKDPENKGLLSFVREDGRIPCGVNNFGTRSGRGAQRAWVNAPSSSALYGNEIRKCIIAEEGKELVAVDMKSAQLSIAAYYANNIDYYGNVATGLEFTEAGLYVGETAHCVNARMFGMVTEEQWREAVKTQNHDLIELISLIRKNSKGGSFATLFGASGKKVAVTIGIPEQEGNKRKEQFLTQLGLTETNKQLQVFEGMYKRSGGFYLPLAHGYWLWNNSSHKSLNTIVQGFEALAQKLCCIKFRKECRTKGWEGKVKKILDVHDEVLLECDVDVSDEAGKLLGRCYTWAAKQIFNWHVKHPDHFANPKPPLFPIDLNGGFKKGNNYYEVH